MSRLRDANPDRLVEVRNDQLKHRIVSLETTWRVEDRRSALGQWRGRLPRLPRMATSAVALAVLAVALTVALSGSSSNIAQAFPALSGPSVLTPATLQQSPSLKSYGVAPDAGGLDIKTGHTVDTRWGAGYVLTSSQGFMCLVAPGLSAADWGASCERTDAATSSGTRPTLYARDDAAQTARLLALLPQGANATTRTAGGPPREVNLRDGVLAIDIDSPTDVAITVNDHTRTLQVSPQNAFQAPDPARASPSKSAGSATARAIEP
jgi:hypothetical protein